MKLNRKQKLAIESISKDVVVLACAGSGKTEVLTQRIIRLLKEGFSPKEICAVTFTRKAAGELRKRIDAGVGTWQTHGLRIGTFHSLCLEMIESYPVLAGYGYGSKLVVYDEEDKASIMKEIKGRFSTTTPERIIRSEYLNILQRSSAIDYDMMVKVALTLLQDRQVQQHYHAKYRFLFVDEFQDTDIDQIRWINFIKPEYLFVVGDDDQNIYGWRGTDVKAFREFQRAPEREKIILPRNYRSTSRIIDVANAVIAKEPERIKKTMVPASTMMAGEVEFLELDNPMLEGARIKHLIKNLNRMSIPLREIAILGRTNRQLDELCEYLKTLGLPVERIGRKNDLWKKAGWRLGANILRLLYSPWDAHVYKFILRELGISMNRNLDVEIIHNTIRGNELWNCYEGEFKEAFRETIRTCHKELEENDLPSGGFLEASAHTTLEIALNNLPYRTTYDSMKLSNRKEQLEKLLAWLLKKDWSIKQFVQWFNFREVQDELEDPDIENKAKLMTVHVAKGLEFEAVIMPFCNSDTWPNRRSDPNEERRLFYVAITRAKSYLFFTRAEEDIRGAPTTISSFMEDLRS